MESACRASVFILVLSTQSDWRAATRQPAFISRRGRRLTENRGIDVKTAKRKRSTDDVGRFNGCEMELARGASHIASMLYEHSIHAAVRETLLQFEASHGREDLKGFAYALLGRLEQRCKPEAVEVLHHFIEHGRLPEQPPGVLPKKPVSTRKPIAPEQRFTQSRTSRAGAMTEAA
jgi:hypothetical protein